MAVSPHPPIVPELKSLHASMHYLGRYERTMPVSIERMLENALDWEHLPYLHQSNFYKLDLIDKSPTHWRASVRLRPAILGLKQTVCLTLDKKIGVWVSVIEAGFARGIQIYTEAVKLGPRKIKVLVDFFAPLNKPLLRFMGPGLKKTYQTLYNEDEAMMIERQIQLDKGSSPKPPAGHWPAPGPLEFEQEIGLTSELLKKQPLLVEHGGQPFFLSYQNKRWIARRAQCPHMLGPLEDCIPHQGTIVCPWHGYQFSLHSGQCIDHPRLTLGEGPPVVEQDGRLYFQSEMAR